MQNIDLRVEGMSCELCVMSIEGALSEIGAKGKVDLASGTVTVEYDENNLFPEKIKETIEEQGFKVTIIDLWEYFTPEQQEKLLKRNAQLSPVELDAIRTEGPDLTAKLRTEMEKSTPADNPEVVKIAKRAKELLDMIRDSDPEIDKVVERFHYDNPDYELVGMNLKLYQYFKKSLSYV